VALAWQGVVIVERIIASFLPAGTLTALNYGFKIMSTLAELLAGSVGTAALPVLSRAFARHAHDEERKTFRDTLEIGLTLTTLAAVFCLMLDRHIMRLIFERGNFTSQATDLMAMVFFYYSLSLLFFGGMRVLSFYLFARNEAVLFVRLVLMQYALNVLFDLFYVGVLGTGAAGIPLGMVTALTLTLGNAYYRNAGGLREVLDRTFGDFLAKNLAAAALAAATVWGLAWWLAMPRTGKENFIFLCVVCAAGSVAFFAMLAATRAVPISRISVLWESPEDSSSL
jgi:peptidoglycan biosynthesis protein MviN/MurJ (putative lipid II flippase)